MTQWDGVLSRQLGNIYPYNVGTVVLQTRTDTEGKETQRKDASAPGRRRQVWEARNLQAGFRFRPAPAESSSSSRGLSRVLAQPGWVVEAGVISVPHHSPKLHPWKWSPRWARWPEPTSWGQGRGEEKGGALDRPGPAGRSAWGQPAVMSSPWPDGLLQHWPLTQQLPPQIHFHVCQWHRCKVFQLYSLQKMGNNLHASHYGTDKLCLIHKIKFYVDVAEGVYSSSTNMLLSVKKKQRVQQFINFMSWI